MRRRDFVKAIVATTVAASELSAQQTAPPVAQKAPPNPKAPGPVPWMHGLMDVKPLAMTPLVADAVAQTDSHFFTERQMATLNRFSSLLMPPLGSYPGAIEAGAPEFLDFLIGSSPTDRQQMYRAGLDRLYTEAQQHFGIAFAAVGAEQADKLIRPWLRTWMPDNPPHEPHARFINVAHTDIRTATMNSQAWGDAARQAGHPVPAVDLFWYPVEPDLHGRVRAAISSHASNPQASLSGRPQTQLT